MKKILLVGLGNVGTRFDGTRHNLGIEALRAWIEEKKEDSSWQVTPWREEIANSYQLSVACPAPAGRSLGEGWKLEERSGVSDLYWEIHCLFPTTMMNTSGQAVAAYLKKISLVPTDMVVVHDDVELPLGEVVVTAGGSAKGHNGVRSIQQELGTNDFRRLRLGVGRPPEGVALSDFVLAKFLPEEKITVEIMIQKAVEALSITVF